MAMSLDDERTRSLTWTPRLSNQPRVLAFWDGGMQSCDLAPDKPVVVGRSEDCELTILHPSVSRRHVRIVAGPPTTVEDLGSSNGVRIQGERLGKGPHVVREGQVIELGVAMLVVQGAEASPAAPVAGMSFERFVDLVAKSHLSVLIVGETGSGKEVMAERIHTSSPRASGPLLTINCAALPETLLEAELFGHEKGAFTGAIEARAGLIESADRGTLFLDEVGEMSPSVQAALLRVLENREVQRIGSTRARAIDVRFVAATHRDLEALVREGRFRQDLLFRINGVTVPISPLRDRHHEIVPIAKALLARAAGRDDSKAPSLTRAAEAMLLRHSWPGNVRELRNVIERAYVLAEGKTIDAPHLMLGSSPFQADGSLSARVESFEREQIVSALAEARGNQTKAAALLGVSRRTLIHRIEHYGLPRPRKA